MEDRPVADREATDPTQAFEDLRAEVFVMRRAVEALPGAWEENQPPDYSPDLGRIAKSLAMVEQRLGTIEAQPALGYTPETYAARIANSGQSVIREAERAFQKASIETAHTTRQLGEMIGHMRGRKEQREKVFFWAGIAGLGMLFLGLAASPFLASYLPFGWDGIVASIVMDQPDRWDAGAALMKVANPEAWDTLAADWRLITGNKANAKAIAACQQEATKTKKAQSCRIAVPVSERTES